VVSVKNFHLGAKQNKSVTVCFVPLKYDISVETMENLPHTSLASTAES
jgi:hypothetical protein